MNHKHEIDGFAESGSSHFLWPSPFHAQRISDIQWTSLQPVNIIDPLKWSFVTEGSPEVNKMIFITLLTEQIFMLQTETLARTIDLKCVRKKHDWWKRCSINIPEEMFLYTIKVFVRSKKTKISEFKSQLEVVSERIISVY